MNAHFELGCSDGFGASMGELMTRLLDRMRELLRWYGTQGGAYKVAKALSDFVGIVMRLGFLKGAIVYIESPLYNRAGDALYIFYKWPLKVLYILFALNMFGYYYLIIRGIFNHNTNTGFIGKIDDEIGNFVVALVLFAPTIIVVEGVARGVAHSFE